MKKRVVNFISQAGLKIYNHKHAQDNPEVAERLFMDFVTKKFAVLNRTEKIKNENILFVGLLVACVTLSLAGGCEIYK